MPSSNPYEEESRRLRDERKNEIRKKRVKEALEKIEEYHSQFRSMNIPFPKSNSYFRGITLNDPEELELYIQQLRSRIRNPPPRRPSPPPRPPSPPPRDIFAESHLRNLEFDDETINRILADRESYKSQVNKKYKTGMLKYHPDKPTGDAERAKSLTDSMDYLRESGYAMHVRNSRRRRAHKGKKY